ncbi:PREDICTED: leucine-rich repeat-containing protein 3-like, partial [Fulmarus glacialis]|uniref:leucine-rich repeat-containing protein 3-like n=1 Tax=Fulmarus glacialis TaxID=30455 RepID=UPI00051AEAE3
PSEEEGLKTFRCSNARLTEVPRDIPNDTNKLYLDSNRIPFLPRDAFRDLPLLLELALSHNAIARVESDGVRTVALAAGSSGGIVCDSSAQEEHVGKAFLQVIADTDFCNVYKKTTDIAMLVTMFGWFAMVI